MSKASDTNSSNSASVASTIRRLLSAVVSSVFNRRTARWSSLVAVAVAGTVIGLLVGGRVETPVGPADASLSLAFSAEGGTEVEVPPLGALRLDSHAGPLLLKAQITRLRPAATQAFINDPAGINALEKTVTDEIQRGVIWMAVRAVVASLVVTALLALALYRSWRRALAATLGSVLLMAAMSGVAWGTFRPSSVAEPRYTGLLANAPQLVGDAQAVIDRFDEYRGMLAKLVGNVSELYATTSTLPVYTPDPDTVRVLHVSDIHLNPLAWDVIRNISEQFKVDVIIDSGDLTDHGSRPEDRFVANINTLKVPYVFVRGNHDSKGTETAVSKIKNAVVLDDRAQEVAGILIYGAGDPRFTPDKTNDHDAFPATALEAQGVLNAETLRALPNPPAISVVHDPTQARPLDGLTPLVLAGHTHQRKTELLPNGTRLFIQGSTGGAGLRGLEHESPTKINLSILYLNRTTQTLQAWDDFTLGGLGEQSVQVERHLATPPQPPTPTTTPSR
ncbi:metallophosphoesterase [Actinocorallia sp. A-T 12471]|uniref:metallophosphoesterase family protein n=1 Tax=Actinocorallia sp. A-T 12471 TaxID=3089813 RepID=UPI0029CE315E|nr:metallophosphoesterase [Actinocorallia sp. A-T 12471]MDX6738140.1 metallophosphoesterase [Actinocorallia sp. A-T 12471]